MVSFNSAESLADAYKPDLLRLIGGMIIPSARTVLLVNMETEIFRYIVSTLALFMVYVLATGWRFHGNLGNGALIGLGGVAGVTGGIAGVPGPPVILFYMATIHPVKVIRANNLLFLLDLIFLRYFFLVLRAF